MPLPKAQSAVILFVSISSVFLSSVETCSVILYPSRRPYSKLHEGAKSSTDGEATFSESLPGFSDFHIPGLFFFFLFSSPPLFFSF